MPVTSTEITTQIDALNEDLLAFDGDGIIVPTISDGLMRAGIAARVKDAAGGDVEEAAMGHAPIAVGAALVTEGGKLKTPRIIHAPIIEQAGMRVGVENIRRATRAGLLAATHYELDHIAIPGMGYGEAGVPFDEAARAIIDEVRAYKQEIPSRVTLMDATAEMFESFMAELGES